MSKEKLKKTAKRLLVLFPAAVAAVVVIVLVRTRTDPVREPETEAVRTLRVIEAPVLAAVPHATGYGVSRPARIWEAIAQVKGTVTHIHPRLKSGEMIDEGEKLLEIDREEYEVSVRRLESRVEQTRAALEELDVREESTERLLETETRSMELARSNYRRKQKLFERDVIAEDEKDREEQNFLRQKVSVRRLEEALSSIPPKRRELEAAREERKAELEQARIDLTKTAVKAPFDGRLGEVKIQSGQFMRLNDRLFDFYSTDALEIEVRFRPEQIQALLKRPEFGSGISPDGFNSMFELLKAEVILQSGEWRKQWEGKVDRLRETVEPSTRDIKVVITINRCRSQVTFETSVGYAYFNAVMWS